MEKALTHQTMNEPTIIAETRHFTESDVFFKKGTRLGEAFLLSNRLVLRTTKGSDISHTQ